MELFGNRGSAILIRPDVLDPEYVPDVLPFRDSQLREIATSISYAVDGGRSTNIFAIGPPGTGKTASLRYVLRELKSYSPMVRQAYVNAWVHRSRFAVLSQIAVQIRSPVPRRGLAADEIFSSIVDTLSSSRGAVIVIDEADRLSQAQDVLYDLSRLNEFVDVPLVVITVANTDYFLSRLDPRVISTLFSRRVEFPRYTVPQLKEILKERAKLALAPDTYSDSVLGLCAAVAWKRGGDARVAISCLYEAAVAAESEGADRITPEHVRRVADKVAIPEPALSDPRYAPIIDILREKGELRVRELYELYVQKGRQVTPRAFRNYLRELQAMGLVEIRRLPVRGNVRAVRLLL